MLVKEFPAGTTERVVVLHKKNTPNFVCHKNTISLLGQIPRQPCRSHSKNVTSLWDNSSINQQKLRYINSVHENY